MPACIPPWLQNSPTYGIVWILCIRTACYILNFLSQNQSKIWKVMGFFSAIIGLVCFALSPTFKQLFGGWSFLSVLIYIFISLIVLCIVLYAKRIRVSKSFLLKGHVICSLFLLICVYSVEHDKAVSGKPDALSTISYGSFALMSLSMSRKLELGFETGLFNFFLACLTEQLMKISWILSLIAVVCSYFLINFRCFLDSKPENGPHDLPISVPEAEGPSGRAPLSRYESQKRRDWNTFLQYLRNHNPPLTLARCSGAHVIEFLRFLDQFGKTKVHITGCPYFGHPNPPAPCACPLRQAWGSLDALIGRLRAAYEENGGRPESNPFGARVVRIYLREVTDIQAKARGIPYEKKKRRRTTVTDSMVGANMSAATSSSGGAVAASGGDGGGGDSTGGDSVVAITSM